jgi:hypothetical protein
VRYLAAMLLVGCVASRYNVTYKAGKEVEIHQCNLPILVGFAGLSDEDVAVIQSALSFWESNAGQPLFFDSGQADNALTDNLLVFSNATKAYYGDDLATTETRTKDECIQAAKITFNYALSSFSPWRQEFIVRHEIGHALGLDDAGRPNNMMYNHIGDHFDAEALSDSELRALRRYYGNPY